MKIHKVNSEIVNLQNNLGFSLCTILFICCVIATSDRRKKSEMEVSADWYVAVEHWRLSSIRIIFVDYQTKELQCNYQSYIQGYSTRDAWGFSGIAPIAPSGGFSAETLTGVQLYYERLSQIGVFLLWKMESPDHCITAMRTCCEKGGLIDQMLIKQYYHSDIYSSWEDLAYDRKLEKKLTIQFTKLKYLRIKISIQERKELHNIKCYYISLKFFSLINLNQVYQKYTSILSSIMTYSSKVRYISKSWSVYF